MKLLATLAALLLSASAAAQTIRYEVQTAAGAPVAGMARTTTQSACDAALRIRNVSGEYHCHRVTIITGACSAVPAPVTTQQPCPAGTGPGTWPQTTTVTQNAQCVRTTTVAPTAPTAAQCPPIVTPGPVSCTGTTLHFAANGNNSNPGTQAAPKLTVTRELAAGLPAGSCLLFNRGDTLPWPHLILENLQATPAAPLVFDAYGSGTMPILNAPAEGIWFGSYNNTSFDGGYTFRNLVLQGSGNGKGMFWQSLRNITLENVLITGFAIGIESQGSSGPGVHHVRIVNSQLIGNRSMGILGQFSNALIEGNSISGNNFGGSGFDHGTYLSGKTGASGENIIIRNNRYTRNSVVNGTCTGGNMTFHGQMDNVLIEGNTIEQDRAAPGCWLMSITQGYTSAEGFRNFVVRGNKLINGGNTAMAVHSAPGIVIESNVISNSNPMQQTAIGIGSSEYSGGDLADTGATVRNNTACQSGGATGSVVAVNSPGATVSGNVVRTGADATTGVCAR